MDKKRYISEFKILKNHEYSSCQKIRTYNFDGYTYEIYQIELFGGEDFDYIRFTVDMQRCGDSLIFKSSIVSIATSTDMPWIVELDDKKDILNIIHASEEERQNVSDNKTENQRTK